MRLRRADALLLLLVASMLASPSAARASSTIKRSVVAAGGARATGGGRVLVGTVGQASIGKSTGPARILSAGFWCSAVGATVSVGGDDSPPELAFASPAPNPAVAAVQLAIALPGPSHVRLAVFDAAGRSVRVLEDRSLGAGPHAWTWDLRGESGQRVRAGVYFSRLVVNEQIVGSRRIVVVR